MKKYKSPRANERAGKSFGFCGIDRISSISIKNAQTIDWHNHEETEVICCLKGSLTYEFRHHPTITLPSNCFMVIQPSMEHRLIGGIDGPCRRFSFFLQGPSPKHRLSTPVSAPEFRELLSLLLEKRLRPRSFPIFVQQSILRLADLTENKSPLSVIDSLTARSDAFSALVSLANAPKPSAAKPETRLMGEAINWLTKHHAERISIDRLVAYMGYGRSMFFELFKRHTGIAPVEWLVQYRINRAKVLLSTTPLDISSIAKQCGFTDPTFFSRIFKRRVGHSPSQFRESTQFPEGRKFPEGRR